MMSKLKNIQLIGLLLFSIATSFSLYSQEPEEDVIDFLLDDLFFNDKEFIDDILESLNTYNYIYTSVSYNSNTFFSGRDSGINQFNLVPQIAYYSSSGFNLSVSGQYYEVFEPNWDLTNLSIGYANRLGKEKQVNYSVGYTRFFYSDGWDGFTNSFDLNLGIKNKQRNLGAKIAATYLFGTDHSFQIRPLIYGIINISKNTKYSLKFKPQLNFIIAQQTLALEKLIGQGVNTEVEYVYEDVFDLFNSQINLPVSLTTKSWNLELGYNLNLPNAVATEPQLNTTSFFNLSVGYLFDLKKI